MIQIAMRRYIDSKQTTDEWKGTEVDVPLQKEDEFYTPGSDDLLKARRKIAEFSLARCVTQKPFDFMQD